MKHLILLVAVLVTSLTESSLAEARRLEVLYLGGPDGSHRPLDRFRTIRRALGVKGINFTYAPLPTALSKDNLAKYDALLLYGNHDVLLKNQEQALLEYSENGGGCVFLHMACGCFKNSDAFIKLLGAQFKSHGHGVFEVETVTPDHEIMTGYQGFECWDETYVHQKHNEDRTVLQMREDEPWTWVRNHGKGRIFYTASGHDQRCWSQPNYQDLILRGILWSVGPEKAALVTNLKLPELTYYKPEVPIIPKLRQTELPDRNVPDDELQNPLPVKESLKLAQVPAGFELQLFASEPDIVNPIAINWDSSGRMWAVEAFDYPNSQVMNTPGQDRIKILEDTNQDGTADKVSIFAEGLSICTSVVPFKDGCITTDGEEMVYLADTNNDGKADKRTVVFKGLKIWDTHACTSNLRYGFDGWIYATVGYAGIDITTGDKHVKEEQGVFRFKPDGSDIEFLQGTSNNTWGLGFTMDGRVMGSTANINPSWWLDVPLALYRKSGLKAKLTPYSDSADQIFPITFDYLQIDCKEGVTAGAGHAIYTGDLYPQAWRNQRVFVCEPTAKLVTAPQLKRRGTGFKTTNFEQNLYASADAWSAPVAVETGPDGAVYIADWYNSIVQHAVYGPGQEKGAGNAYISKHRDREHGRIYRIAPKAAKPSTNPKLDSLENSIRALGHPNLFWRLTAQRVITERGHTPQTLAALTKVAINDTIAASHALYALATLGTLGTKEQLSELAKKHLTATTPSLQLAAVRNLPATAKNAQKLLALFKELTPDSQHAALIKVASAPISSHILATLKKNNKLLRKDPYLHEVLNVANAIHSNYKANPTDKKRHFPLSASARRGAEIYKSANCHSCHQAHGEGLAKAFPPLNKSDWLSRDHKLAIGIILKGLTGPITVNDQDYNGDMPAQENLTDKQLTDVLNFVRNKWDNSLGDINADEVTRVRASLKDRDSPLTAKDSDFFRKSTVHNYQFNKHLLDPVGQTEAKIEGGTRQANHSDKGIDLSENTGESSQQIKNDQYLLLPNNIISDTAKQGVIGEVSIEMVLEATQNRPWAQAWYFGTNDQDQPNHGKKPSSYITLIPMNGETGYLRLEAHANGKKVIIDGNAALQQGRTYYITATFTRSEMALYLDGQLLGKQDLPKNLDLTTFQNDNNWLGRSQYPYPVFDGLFKSLKIYSTAIAK